MKTGINTTDLIKDISNSINFWTEIIYKTYFSKYSKIKPIHIFEFVLHLAEFPDIGSKALLEKMYFDFSIRNKVDIKRIKPVISSMNEARDKININIWKLVFNDITQLLQKYIKGPRYFAIDGSYIVTQNSAIFKEKYKCKSGSYLPHVLTSLLYDIDYGFPVHTLVCDHTNERQAALEHMQYIKKGDVVVMDRGYYSKELLDAFMKRGIHVLFRMKCNTSKHIWEETNDDVLDIKDGYNCRFIKYVINEHSFMLLTSLLDSNIDSHEFIKELYHKRWDIETAFRYVKQNLSFAHMHARTVPHLVEEVNANFVLSSLAKVLEFHAINMSTYKVKGGVFNRNVLVNDNPNGKNDLKINFKSCLLFIDNIFTTNNIDLLHQFNILVPHIISNLVPIKKNRSFKLVSRQPQNHWIKQDRTFMKKNDDK